MREGGTLAEETRMGGKRRPGKGESRRHGRREISTQDVQSRKKGRKSKGSRCDKVAGSRKHQLFCCWPGPMLQGTPCDATGRRGKLSLAAALPRQIRARRAVAVDRQEAGRINEIQSLGDGQTREVENERKLVVGRWGQRGRGRNGKRMMTAFLTFVSGHLCACVITDRHPRHTSSYSLGVLESCESGLMRCGEQRGWWVVSGEW